MNGNNGVHLYLDLMKKVLTASVYEESAWSIVARRRLQSPAKPLRFFGALLRNLIIKAFQTRSVVLLKTHPFNENERNEGKDWPLFGYTMAGHLRLDNVQNCIEDVLRNGVPGDFIETGSWRGGMVIFMRALLKAHGVTNRKVWVADSFEGLPVPRSADDGVDLSGTQNLKVSLEKVKSNFARFALLDQQVEFLQGWFCDTLPKAPIQKLAILRLDGDMYHSTMDALTNLYHKVSKGGYVIVDDYFSWPSCRNAVTDFLTKNSIQCEIKTIDWTGVYWRV